MTAVGTCAEALENSKTEYVDLYLPDNWLPDGTGIELCKQIRRIHPNTPVIFYSAAALDSDRKEALEAGANAYMVKYIKGTVRSRRVNKAMNLLARHHTKLARRVPVDAIARRGCWSSMH